MILKKSNVRMFNGHLKMSQESLKKVFVMQLGNIFSIKSYLVVNLPVMANNASFTDLKHAIMENVDEIRLQLLKMKKIYTIINEVYHPRQSMGIRFLTIEAYVASKAPGISKLESDLTMLIHLRILESVEVASYSALHDMALSLPQKDLSLLLQQNLDMAKDSKELYELITKKYIN